MRDALHHGKRAANKGGRSVFMMNLRPNYKLTTIATSCGRRFQVIASHLSKVANFNLSHLHLAPQMGVAPFEFCRDLRSQKTRVPGLSCGVVCVILRLAISVEHRLVSDGQTHDYDTYRDSMASSRDKNLTRHKASTSMYSLTFRIRLTTPPQYGRNGTAHAAGATILSPASGVFAGMRSACGVLRAACGGPGELPLGSATHFHSVAIATQPVHRLQIRPVLHN